jgi:hypothetical protein
MKSTFVCRNTNSIYDPNFQDEMGCDKLLFHLIHEKILEVFPGEVAGNLVKLLVNDTNLAIFN